MRSFIKCVNNHHREEGGGGKKNKAYANRLPNNLGVFVLFKEKKKRRHVESGTSSASILQHTCGVHCFPMRLLISRDVMRVRTGATARVFFAQGQKDRVN